MAVACIAATQTHKRSLGRVCEHSSCSMPACSTLLRVRAEARGWYRQGGGGPQLARPSWSQQRCSTSAWSGHCTTWCCWRGLPSQACESVCNCGVFREPILWCAPQVTSCAKLEALQTVWRYTTPQLWPTALLACSFKAQSSNGHACCWPGLVLWAPACAAGPGFSPVRSGMDSLPADYLSCARNLLSFSSSSLPSSLPQCATTSAHPHHLLLLPLLRSVL